MAAIEISGIYSITSKACGRVYWGSASCKTSRFAMHKRELRDGTHANTLLTAIHDQYGPDNLKYELVELFKLAPKNTEQRDIDILTMRVIEQQYIDNYLEEYGRDSILNMALEVCDLGSSIAASERMRKAWANVTPEQKAERSEKISKSIKQRFKEDPNYLEQCRSALAEARNSQAMLDNKHSPEANQKRSRSLKGVWDNRTNEERKDISRLISDGMMESQTPEERSAVASLAAKALWDDKGKVQAMVERRSATQRSLEVRRKHSKPVIATYAGVETCFYSGLDAHKVTGVSRSAISTAIKNRKPVSGYTFRFANEHPK